MFGAAVMARFDIVGFDPRGVGSSSPVHCLNQRPVVAPAAPDNATETAKIVDSATAVTAACEANSGDVLPYLGTWNVARDLEQIRIALGDDKLTYVGWSYGTLIGALYASLFPTHIRAMVLDGVVDPNLDLRQFDLDQAVAFQRQFNKFFAYCAGRTQCPFHSHGKPRAAFDALMAKLDADPRILSERDAVYGIMTYLSDDNLSGLGAALAAAAKGNGSRLRDAGAMSASFLDGFDAVFCADYAASRDPETYASMAADLAKAAPDFGAPNAYFNFDCVYWPFQSQRVPARVSARGAPPILIISATGDPNTPHAWGKSLAGQLSSSVLLTRDGDGHTSMFRSACVRTAAERYIVKLATPRKGTTCK
jgi:pimeloyl-ACP methyl ester carboxylesterase